MPASLMSENDEGARPQEEAPEVACEVDEAGRPKQEVPEAASEAEQAARPEEAAPEVAGEVDEAGRPDEEETEVSAEVGEAARAKEAMPEVPMCIRCGQHPINSRKAVRVRSLCCNKCPDHGPWCTMYSAHKCTPQCGASGPSKKVQAMPSKEEAAQPAEPSSGASEKPIEAASASQKPRVGRPPKTRQLKTPRRKRGVDDDDTPARPPVERALRRVQQEFQKKMDQESKRQQKRKKEVARDIKETQKRLKRHSMLRLSMMRRKKAKTDSAEATGNPFFAGVDDETAAAASNAALDDMPVGDVKVKIESPGGLLHSPVANLETVQDRPPKRNRRSTLPVVLNDLKNVYAIIDDIKHEKKRESRVKEERSPPVKEEKDDEEPLRTPMKLEDLFTPENTKNSLAVKMEEDDGDSMATCRSQGSGEDEEGETPDEKRQRGEAALVRARQLYKEIMQEKKGQQHKPKRVVTPNARYEAFDDDSRYEETPKPQEKCGRSESSSSSEFFMMPAEARVVFEDSKPNPPQQQGGLLDKILKRTAPAPKELGC